MQTAPDPRAELERLRKMKRLRELEAKARGQAAAPAGPSLRSETDAIIEEAAAAIPGGYEAFNRKLADPQRMAAMGYVPDPLAKSGYAKPQAQQPRMADTGTQNNLLNDIGRGLAAPLQRNENLRTSVAAPLQFGQGLGQGVQAMGNNAMAVGTDALNSGLNLADPKRQQFERPRIDVFDKNVLLDEGGVLASDAGIIPRAIGQVASARVPLGKISPGGGFGHQAAKDALGFALSTDYQAPRLSDFISSETPVLGPVADLLRSNENDPAIVSMMKNLGEDLTTSAVAAGVLKLIDGASSIVRPGAQAGKGQDPRLDPAVAAQIRRVLANEPAAPAGAMPAPTGPKPFSAPAEPAGGGIIGRNKDRIIGGVVGATIGGAGDAYAAPGDGNGEGNSGPLNAGTGAFLGAFGPRTIASATSRGFRAAARPFRPAGMDERVAARAVRNALKSGGIRTPEEAAATFTARFGDKPASIADLTQEGVSTAAGLSRRAGATGEAARARGEELLQNRAGRLERDIAQANPNLNPATITGDVDRMVALAQQQATPAYNALRQAYPMGSLTSPRLEQLSEIESLGSSLKAVNDYRATTAATEGRVVGDFEYWDLVKRDLDAKEQQLINAGATMDDIRLRKLEDTRNALVQELDTLVPDYSAARQLGGEAPKMREAMRQGERVLGQYQTAEEVARLVSGITGQQLTALQAGVIRSMVKKTEGATGAMASLMSAGSRRKLSEVFGPEAADALQARFAADATIVNNATRINPNVGSVTSQAQMGEGGFLPMAAEAIRAFRSPIEATLAAMSKGGAYSKAQRDLMGQMLLEGATPENLARIYGNRQRPRGGTPTPPPVPPTGGGAGPGRGPGPTVGPSAPANALRVGPRPAPSEEAVLAAMAQVTKPAPGKARAPMGPPTRDTIWDGPVPTKPQSLRGWIRSQGGINDRNYMTGDMKAVMGRANGMPGLINRESGTGLDELARKAYTEGFDVDPEDAGSLMRLLEEEFGGNPSYRIGAKEEWDAYQDTLRARRGNLPGQTSSSPAAFGGAALGGLTSGGATYAATGDEDLALKAGLLGGIGGGVLGNRLAKGSTPKPPKGPPAPVSSTPKPPPVRMGFGGRRADPAQAEIDQLGRLNETDTLDTAAGKVSVQFEVSRRNGVQGEDRKVFLLDGKRVGINTLVSKIKEANANRPAQSGFGGRSLPMDEPSRMQRAREQGFDVDTPLYHGTNKNFDEFDTSAEIRNANEAGSAVYLTPDPEAAGSYAKGWRESVFGPNEITDGENIRPVYARLRNPYTINVRSQSEDLGMTAEEAASIRAAGYDGIVIRTVELDGQGRLVPGSEKPFEYVVFDPSNIRGKFAKFDPSETQSSKLLAGMSGNPEAIGAGLGTVFAPDADGDGEVSFGERAGAAITGGVIGRGARAIGNRLGGAPKAPPVRGPKVTEQERRISQTINEKRSRGQSDESIAKQLSEIGINISPERIDYFARMTPREGSGPIKGNVTKFRPKPPASQGFVGSRDLPMNEGGGSLIEADAIGRIASGKTVPTSAELDDALKGLREAEFADLVRQFGGDRQKAEKFKSLWRQAENAPTRQEADMLDAQRQKLIEGMPDVEPREFVDEYALRQLRDAFRDIENGNAVKALNDSMTDLPTMREVQDGKISSRAQAALAILRKATQEARLQGLDPKQMMNSALENYGRRFSDPVDAEFMVGEVKKLFAAFDPSQQSSSNIINKQGFFGGGKAESRPKPPPTGNRLAKPKPAQNALPPRLAADLNKSKVSPATRATLNENAALPPGERKSVMEATGWSDEILRIAAPYIRPGSRMESEIGNRIARLVEDANANPIEYALRQTMAKGAFDEAQKRFKQASGARSRAETNLEKLRARNMLNPNQPAVQQQLTVHKQRRDDAEQFFSEAARLRDEAKVMLDRADVELMSLEQVRAFANKEIQRITDALGGQRPKSAATAMLPAYNPLGPAKVGGAASLLPPKPPGGRPSKQAADELAHLLFEQGMADKFAKIQSGEITPTQRNTFQQVMSWYARHPSLAAGSAVLAGASGVGYAALATDQGERAVQARENARKRTGQPEPELPGPPAWDWEKLSRNPRFAGDTQAALQALGYKIGRIDNNIRRADGKRTESEKALYHFLWTMDNTRDPNAPPTEAEWDALKEAALQARRKR